jgi:hypothetical protein
VYDKQNKYTEKSGVYSVEAVAQQPSFSINASPSMVKVGQQITFSAFVNNPEVVSKAEIIFSDANVTKTLERSGNTWSYPHTMAEAKSNRPYTIRVYDKQNQYTAKSGFYSVEAVAQPQMALPSHAPKTGKVNQDMTFSVQINNPETVNRVTITFYDLQGNFLASDEMFSQGYGNWSKTRRMMSNGDKRYVIKAYYMGNKELSSSQTTFTVIK